MVLQIFLSPNPLPVVSPSLHKSPPTHQYVVDWFPDFPEAESFSVFKARKIPSLYQKVYCQLYIIHNIYFIVSVKWSSIYTNVKKGQLS